MHCGGTAQLTFAFGGFLGEDVALERLAPLDRPATANLKALRSAFLGFHLRHDVTLLWIMNAGGRQTDYKTYWLRLQDLSSTSGFSQRPKNVRNAGKPLIIR